MLVGQCARCGAPASLGCTVCGRTVCRSCLDPEERMCLDCESSTRRTKSPIEHRGPPSRKVHRGPAVPGRTQ
ncbi:MAG TPA: hypothetical protein VMG99_06970 [Thermoplasmata archaeon]|nr:hypothetical protein [Thermoplasmata archaeon]